jgi:hypothetical protein
MSVLSVVTEYTGIVGGLSSPFFFALEGAAPLFFVSVENTGLTDLCLDVLIIRGLEIASHMASGDRQLKMNELAALGGLSFRMC